MSRNPFLDLGFSKEEATTLQQGGLTKNNLAAARRTQRRRGPEKTLTATRRHSEDKR